MIKKPRALPPALRHLFDAMDARVEALEAVSNLGRRTDADADADADALGGETTYGGTTHGRCLRCAHSWVVHGGNGCCEIGGCVCACPTARPLRAVFTVIDVGTGLGDRLFVTLADREDKANHRVAMRLPLEHPFAALGPSDVGKNYVITLEEEL
jgi:hypothetical protein